MPGILEVIWGAIAMSLRHVMYVMRHSLVIPFAAGVVTTSEIGTS